MVSANAISNNKVVSFIYEDNKLRVTVFTGGFYRPESYVKEIMNDLPFEEIVQFELNYISDTEDFKITYNY